MRNRWLVLAALSLAGGCKSTSASRAWSLTDLGEGRCVALNSQGQVLGIDSTNASFVVGADRLRTMLTWSTADSMAVGLAISDAGDVVGYSEGMQGRSAIRYHGGSWSSIDALSTAPWSAALAFGDQGEIVGVAGVAMQTSSHGFSWSNGTLAALPLPTDKSSAIYQSLASRQIGIVEADNGDTHSFLIENGALRDLGTLGGEAGAPYAMNRAGDVVGGAETASGSAHAWLAAHGSGPVDIAPDGTVSSDARGIDDKRRVAVNALDEKGISHPSVYATGADPVALLQAGAPFVSAHVAAMASDGRIVGWGVPQPDVDGGASGTIHCLLWSPPENK